MESASVADFTLVRCSSISSPWGKGEARCLLWAENHSEHFPDPAQKWLLESFLQKQFYSKRRAVSGPITGSTTHIFDPQDFLISFRREHVMWNLLSVESFLVRKGRPKDSLGQP